MAPMADLISMVRGSTTGSFSNTSLIDGISYIFGRATFFGKPAVVNMSIGGLSGPHDGSSTFDDDGRRDVRRRQDGGVLGG